MCQKVIVQTVENRIRPVACKRWALLFLPCAVWLLTAGSLLAGNFYAGTSPANVPWPGGIVPYEFTNTLTAAQTNTYFDGLREWELAGNVTFVPHTTQTRWIRFAYNTNYIDNVAPGYNPQIVTVSSLSRAQVCHEMGHSFGFTHENIRPDATNFIMVLTNNIDNEPSNIFFFTIDPTSVTNGPYDFESVMHLGWDFASTNPGVLATQQPRPPYFPRYQFRMGNLCLSPGDRAALKYLYGPPAVPPTNLVTTTADYGPGSLRAALYYVTDNPGSVVKFNIPMSDPGYSNGVFNIHLTGYLPPLVSNGMVIDGSTQPGFAGNPLIVVDGSQMIPEAYAPGTVTGLLIYSSSNQVKNISFQGFNWNGLTLEYAAATNNTIAGCWLGLGSAGTDAAPNAYQGIFFVQGAGHNIIGGTNALARNVISGNSQYGLLMSDSNTTGNVILGNYIGTDASGSFSVSNAVGGIGIFTGVGHVIGGTNAAARNVISGNGGVGIFLSGAGVSNNTVRGNYIGLNAAGTAGVPNTIAGIYVTAGASSNTILNNVVSSNNIGLYISDSGTRGNVIQGNLIGTDITGKTGVANGYEGIAVQNGATSNLIGGTVAAAANVISGNYYNLVITESGTRGNVIQGNLIGVDITGKTALPGAYEYEGLVVEGGAASNIIGGTVAGAANVISGNHYGLVISDPGTSGNVFQGNLIGTDITGKTEVPGVYEGLAMGNGATSNTIGGTVAGAGNVISGNYLNVVISNPGTSGNVIQGNLIGTDITGKTALTNQYEGFVMGNEAASNIIGGTVAGAANVISGNYFGLFISDTNTSGNVFEGNLIGVDITGTNALGNGYINFELANGASGNFIGGVAPGAGNIIAYSGTGSGVVLINTATTNNAIRGNSIFSSGSLGIDLNNDGVTPNHTGFLAGPNDLQNYPVITNAFGYAVSTIIAGKLNSLASRTFFIDVYRNAAPNSSGYGEGKFYVGTVSVTTDGSGNATFAYTNSGGNYAGQYISATATAATGDTSEFSADVLASNAPAPSASFTGPFLSRTNGFTFTLDLETNFSYHIQATTNLGTNPIPWINLTNFTPTISSLTFTDRTATNYRLRFYHVVSP
jgi:parallel beta-helix repeat protein